MSRGKGWHKDYYEHALASKGVKTKCNVPNPMNTRSNRELLFGHFITHSRNYQKSVGLKAAECEHDRLVSIMNKRKLGLNEKGKHNSPFKEMTKETRKELAAGGYPGRGKFETVGTEAKLYRVNKEAQKDSSILIDGKRYLYLGRLHNKHVSMIGGARKEAEKMAKQYRQKGYNVRLKKGTHGIVDFYFRRSD